MVFSLTHPALLLALAAPLLAIAIWRRLPPPLGRGQARLALALRLVVLVLIVLALAGLRWESTPDAQTLVVLADRSASIGGAGDQERQAVLRLIEARRGQDQLGLISFGREAVVESPPDRRPAFTDFGTHPNPNYTNVEAALRLAASMMPGDTRRHALLLSDGRQNIGDAITEARLLRSQGTRLDVLPVVVETGPEVRVDAVRAPAAVPPSSRAQVRVLLESNVETPARLRIYNDRALVYDQAVTVQPGETEVTLTLPPAEAGFHTIRAVLDPERDTYAENNVGEALMQVLGTQRVLVVEGQPGAAANVAQGLSAASLEATVVTPAALPRTVGELAAYQSVVLVDVPAGALGTEKMQALQASVRDLGLGLAAFGGPDAFGPGDYAGTPLEALLPIDMEISEQLQKAPIAVVLALESMESGEADTVMRSAAQAVIEQLSARDYVGVTDAQTSGLVIPLQRLTDKKKIRDAIGTANFGDPQSYAPWLTAAGDALATLPSATRHIIVLGDGDTGDRYDQLVAGLVARGITVSAIGIDVHRQAQFMEQMRSIATAGKGRFYQSSDATEIPQLLLKETQQGLKPWIVEERFRPTPVAPSGALAGVDLASFPALDGYVASTAKSASEVVLRSRQRDPVLAQWQYGLGRVIAWTSDTQGRWTGDLLRWPEAGHLLAGVVAWTLPLTSDPGINVQTSLAGDQGHVIAEVRDAPDDARVTATIVGPEQAAVEMPLLSTGPGRFEAEFRADQVGTYILRVVESSRGQTEHATTAGMAVAYSPEYRFLGPDRHFLEELARAGGGTLLADPAAAYRVPLPALRVPRSLAFWLLGLAVILFPLDVAARRLVFRRGDAAAWTALVRRRPVPAAAEATLARLRDRLEQHRAGRRRGDDAAPDEPQAPDRSPEEEALAARLLQRRKKGRGG